MNEKAESIIFNYQLSEPMQPKYISVNPQTNKVHLLVPLTSGIDIGLDNTCKTTLALKAFFGKTSDQSQSALAELKSYKKALEDDLETLRGKNHALERAKKERLLQINIHINVLSAVQSKPEFGHIYKYPLSVQTILGRSLPGLSDNLYSAQLRPQYEDSVTCTVNPLFQMQRATGIVGVNQGPSGLFDALLTIVPRLPNASKSPEERLEQFVEDILKSLSGSTDFGDIKRAVQAQLILIRPDISFQKSGLTEEELKTSVGFSAEDQLEPSDLITYYLGLERIDFKEFDSFAQVESIFELLQGSEHEKKDQMIIFPQLLLAEINFHACHFGQLKAGTNLAKVFEQDPMRTALVNAINNGLTDNTVEHQVCDLMNAHGTKIGLTTALSPEDIAQIRKRTLSHYQQIQSSPHYDEMITVFQSTLQNPGRFFSFRGNLAFDFSEFLDVNDVQITSCFADENTKAFYKDLRADLQLLPTNAPLMQKDLVGSISVDAKRVLETINSAALLYKVDNEESKLEAYSIVRRLLLAHSQPGPRLFYDIAKADSSFFEKVRQSNEVTTLFSEIGQAIMDAKLAKDFHLQVLGKDEMVFSPADIYALGVIGMEEGVLTSAADPSLNDVANILNKLYVKKITVDALKSVGQNIYAQIPTENAQPLRKRIDVAIEKFHLTSRIEKSLETEFKERYPIENVQRKQFDDELKKLKNPQKLQRLLDILGVQIAVENLKPLAQGHGYLIETINSSSQELIKSIHQKHADRYQLTKDMAKALYEAQNESVSWERFSGLSNTLRPDRLEAALTLLEIDYDRVEFNQYDGFYVFLKEDEQAKLNTIYNDYLHRAKRNDDEGEYPYETEHEIVDEERAEFITSNPLKSAEYQIPTAMPFVKSRRGYLLRQIEMRNLFDSFEQQPVEEVRSRGRGSRDAFFARGTRRVNVGSAVERDSAHSIQPSLRKKLEDIMSATLSNANGSLITWLREHADVNKQVYAAPSRSWLRLSATPSIEFGWGWYSTDSWSPSQQYPTLSLKIKEQKYEILYDNVGIIIRQVKQELDAYQRSIRQVIVNKGEQEALLYEAYQVLAKTAPFTTFFSQSSVSLANNYIFPTDESIIQKGAIAKEKRQKMQADSAASQEFDSTENVGTPLNVSGPAVSTTAYPTFAKVHGPGHINFTVSDATLKAAELYRQHIIKSRPTSVTGPRLAKVLGTYNGLLENMSTEDFLKCIINSKKPKCFAEDSREQINYFWNNIEQRLLCGVGVVAETYVFSDGDRGRSKVLSKPEPCLMLFVSSPLLTNDATDQLDIIKNGAIDENAYYQFFGDRVLPLLRQASEQAKSYGKKLDLTIPGLGCGQFAGPGFQGKVQIHLYKALEKLLNTYAHELDGIDSIYFNPYEKGELTEQQVVEPPKRIGNITFMCRDKRDNRKAFDLSQENQNNPDIMRACFVAADWASLPGNDMWIDSRSTDEGVKAAESTLQATIASQDLPNALTDAEIDTTYRYANGRYRSLHHTWKEISDKLPALANQHTAVINKGFCLLTPASLNSVAEAVPQSVETKDEGESNADSRCAHGLSNKQLIDVVRELIKKQTDSSGWEVGGLCGNYTRYTDKQGNKIPQGVMMMLDVIDKVVANKLGADEAVAQIKDIANDRRGNRYLSMLTFLASYRSAKTKTFYEGVYTKIMNNMKDNRNNPQV